MDDNCDGVMSLSVIYDQAGLRIVKDDRVVCGFVFLFLLVVVDVVVAEAEGYPAVDSSPFAVLVVLSIITSSWCSSTSSLIAAAS